MSKRLVVPILAVAVLAAVLGVSVAGDKEVAGTPQQPLSKDLPGNHDLPSPEFQTIDWPDNSSVGGSLRAKLSAPTLSAVDKSLVPVLLPNIDNIGQGSFLINSDVGYSFSLTVPKRYSMGIYAFRLRQTTASITSSTTEKPQKAGNAVVRGQIAHVWESEGWWTALWEEFGARYRLDFSCGVQLNDKECELVLSEILNMLDLAGGNFANR